MKFRSPAPAITDAQCLAAMQEFAAQKGESHDAMWSQMDAQVRAELIGEWRAILECAGVSGQEPVTWGLLDVGSNPPRISGDIFDERNAKANESSGWRAVPLYLGAGRSPAEVPPNWPEEVQEARRVLMNQLMQYRDSDDDSPLRDPYVAEKLDAAFAAVWRSAQPHD